MIRLAEISDLESVLQITHDTISKIYSHYYAEGVVNFFLTHHSRENVLTDVENRIEWLLEEDECIVGTVTIKGNAVKPVCFARVAITWIWQSTHGLCGGQNCRTVHTCSYRFLKGIRRMGK